MTGLYMVTKPMPCCGYNKGMGKVVEVASIGTANKGEWRCAGCNTFLREGEPLVHVAFETYPLYRLTKLDGDVQDERHEYDVLHHLDTVEARHTPAKTKQDTYHQLETQCGLAPF